MSPRDNGGFTAGDGFAKPFSEWQLECVEFIDCWMGLAGTPCVTLVSISPANGATAARTFDGPGAVEWVAEQQDLERNCYFEVNETRPNCAKKPPKSEIVAAVCRHSDIDPLDDQFPFAEERERLTELANVLAADPDVAPSAIIDSGNGIQCLWVTQREPNSSAVTERVESENRAIDSALGGDATFNIDRLLRLPGTLNIPSEKKRAKGRQVARARVLYWSNRVYTAGEAAALGTQLARLVRGTDLVRTRPAAGGTTAKVDNAEVTRFIAALRAAGADKIKNADGLPPVLGIKLEAALVANATLKKRWEGGMDDLPKPDDRSSLDFSIAGLLKLEGFSHVDTGLTLCACVHSKANVDWWKQPKDRLRHVARCVLNSDEPQTKSVWPEPIDFLADAFATPPELHAEHLPTALWPFVTDTATRMGVDPTSVAMGCLVSCASVVNDRWVIQPKRSDHLWTENPRIWAAIVGDPSIRKSPVIAACTGPIDRLDTEARLHHKDEMRAYKAALAARKEDKEAPEPILPKLSRYIIEGATVEAISEVLRDDDDAKHYAPAGKVLARHGEMSEFFGNLDRYTGGKGGGDRGAYLRLYDGGRYTVDRIGRGAFVVPNWSACILGGIQPGPIQRIAKDAAEDGLLQRFMYSVPGADGVGVDRAPDAAAIERYETLIPNLAKLSRFDQRVTLDTRAHRRREHIDAMARALQVWPDTSPRLKAAFGKWPGLFARLCLLFHLINIADSRTTTVVPESTARRVSDFMMDIVLPHLLRADAVMFATAATGHARWIAGYILATKLTRITTRDITRAYHPLRAPERAAELSEVMMSLVTIGWLEPEVPANRSRPVWAWAVNPAVHLKFAKVAADERQRRDKARGNLAQYIAEIRKRRSL